jgi:hypothetical protein
MWSIEVLGCELNFAMGRSVAAVEAQLTRVATQLNERPRATLGFMQRLSWPLSLQ